MEIVVGGQIDKQKIADLACSIAKDKANVRVMGDIEAAMAVKNGDADIYLGACNTGGGGALAMAIALLGMNQCATISMPGTIKSETEIAAEVKAGKKAFGFTAQHIETLVPLILKYLL
ncbi:uncharacterized protein DUF2620 [Hydrogenoanaerobacterium saccharovorans]|uniref:DUF2620 domain-containing protein n=1 Tax=Hydrogenoanaerobacterium saccharovorans TaxID=474960 RepID=A0A1H7ZB63_9FIRM|nr:DUF2620 domain-containing protein [Hydrogenoanaerobacterium saccharovorans]RPF48716.1 uncharacterized protein DUF2620 [Hydrogenoanaerobacterium saccharovorans]SEM55503.1 Protein of unknown function DUF2620 [Hydrogenoanaerobacterium saccharovorans]